MVVVLVSEAAELAPETVLVAVFDLAAQVPVVLGSEAAVADTVDAGELDLEAEGYVVLGCVTVAAAVPHLDAVGCYIRPPEVAGTGGADFGRGCGSGTAGRLVSSARHFR